MARLAALPLLAVLCFAAGCGSAPSTAYQPPHPSAKAAASPAAGATPAPSASPGKPTGALRFVFPVATGASYGKTHSEYPATDIFAKCGTAVRAVTDGVILEINLVDRFDLKHPTGATKGGLSVSLLGDDGVRYYGSHLLRVQTGIKAGVRVSAGQQLGVVGHTGNASGICHLHFGISAPCAQVDDWWIRRGVIWPAKYLDAWHKGQNLSAISEITAWHAKHGCPKAP
ncbi:murein DD-endopeptidase MepM/ murein hydrolase activator NlpD [Allocatelliglobosispora scoriae]|uniref:Murein DD-endopeptidase MepM/ murein hydrolase activator NlpD n=1 Tax=Allocatelliglobosispora scoriae TaxID=643052 RepID=A0A841BWS9_9ACTN|nr:murein DD-endopeptidase MepM/ murein hydrolase activator NlpD [Allocatelliglobosispora scoriae]